MLAMADRPKKAKPEKFTTLKARVPLADVVAKLARLKGTTVADELDRYYKNFQEDLLDEMAKEKKSIEESRRG